MVGTETIVGGDGDDEKDEDDADVDIEVKLDDASSTDSLSENTTASLEQFKKEQNLTGTEENKGGKLASAVATVAAASGSDNKTMNTGEHSNANTSDTTNVTSYRFTKETNATNTKKKEKPPPPPSPREIANAKLYEIFEEGFQDRDFIQNKMRQQQSDGTYRQKSCITIFP